MGSFLDTIQQINQQQPSSFYQKISSISQPINKVKQYYGLFKSVCDSFLINKQKYLQIFQTNKNLSQIWDKQQTNKVDALELFTGLIVFSSQSSFKQKLKLLFIIFDFNEIKNISFVDLQYMILCLCNATFKILNKNAKANQSQIVQWLANTFNENQRINITKLYSFCIASTKIKKFFQIVTKQPNQSQAIKEFLQLQSLTKINKKQLTKRICLNKEKKKQIDDKIDWHRQFSKKISTPYHPNTMLQKAQINWIYGLRLESIIQPFALIDKYDNFTKNQSTNTQIPKNKLKKQKKTSTIDKNKNEQELLYSTSTYMVLYNIKTNRQRYYRGHTRLIVAFVYNKTKQIVISASESISKKSIHIWSYESLQCIKILDTYKPVKSMSLLGKNQELLLVVCQSTNTQTTDPLKQKQGKSTIMIFSLQDKLNYCLIYSYTYDIEISRISNVYTNLDEQEMNMNVWNCFVAVSQYKQTLLFSQFEYQHSLHPYTTIKTLPYDYYQQPSSSKQDNSTIQTHNKITACLALYLNEQNPNLRSFITSEQSLGIFIITGHKNGQLKCLIYNDGQFTSQDILFDFQAQSPYPKSGKKLSDVYKINNYNQDKQARQQFQYQNQSNNLSITCIKHTQSNILFSHGSRITVVPFSYLNNKEQSLVRTVDISEYPHLKLFNPNIHYFTLSKQQIILVTKNQADFISISHRQILFNDMNFTQHQSLTRIKTLTKIQNQNSQAICLLEKPQMDPLIYLTTQERKILIINSFSKQIQNVWQINCPSDTVTAIDVVYTDQDILYFVCGCQSGKLYIRVDNQENPKFYDCVSHIIDVKISKDASYLLVATIEKYLYFFTQINKNFSSPRKLHFQNEIPLSINFLDSNKMFTVNTSAKNVYIIEIPQLKHKNVQKQTQKISISKMKILYPSGKNSYQTSINKSSTNKQSKNQLTSNLHSEKSLTLTKTFLGGELKYFLMTLNNGQLLFFQNRLHLANLSYVNLQAHWGQIANLCIVQGQQKFYTLGKHDNTLIEWQTKSTRTVVNIPQSLKVLNDKGSLFEIQEFQKIKQLSLYYKLLNQSKPDDIYLFKGTTNQKLNQSLRKSLNYLSYNQINHDSIKEIDDQAENQQNIPLKPYMPKYKLNLRQPNISLEMSQVYGLQCFKRSSVVFWGQNENNQKVLYFSSRFLLSLDLSYKRQQKVLVEEKNRISCFIVTQDGKILYAVAQPNTKIRIQGSDDSLSTTHQLGIIHLSTHKQYILSYGILSNGYSINLHNYKTSQLLAKRTTELKIHEFIFINQYQFISLNQIRIWKNLYPSQKIGKATAGILMPNHIDVCLATDNGSLSILNSKKGIFTVFTKAHQSDIISITINKLQNNGFQILTVSKDDKIKVWNQKFNCKLMINLRDQLLKTVKYLVQNQEQKKHYAQILGKQAAKQNMHHLKSLNVRGIDSRKGRVLVYLATGQVYVGKFTLVNRQNQLQRTIVEGDSMMNDSDQESIGNRSHESIEMEMQKSNKKRHHGQYEKQWQKLIQSHSSQTNSIFKKSIKFALHPILPILVSVGGNDKKLLFRNYETSEVIDTYFSQESRITCLKFSKKGQLLVLGFKNGNVKIYEFGVKERQGSIKAVQLRFSQKFIIKQEISCQAINIQFSQKSVYFAVSFIGQSETGLKGSQNMMNENENRGVGFVHIYKQKHQQSQGSMISEDTFYSMIDSIRIKEEDSTLIGSGNYIRCVYDMKFVNCLSGNFELKKESKLQSIKDSRQGREMKSNKQRQGIKGSKQSMNRVCLVMFEQYVNENLIRVNNSKRDKFSVYIIEERTFMKKQFQELDWSEIPFPSLVNVLQLNKFRSEILFLNEFTSKKDTHIEQDEDDYCTVNKNEKDDFKQQNPLSISSMCYYKKDVLIYGATNGKLHLLKISSLLTHLNQTLSELKQSQMAIAKTYPSQASFISHLQLSSDLKYLFVSGQLDDSILKYNLQQLSPSAQLDLQQYDIYQNDSPQIYLTKDKFYNLTNSIMPLRQDIKNVLEDVQNFDQQPKDKSPVGLQVVKVIGRRAYDRFNNIFLHQQNLIYSLGPNLILQNIMDPFIQKLLPSDPDFFSSMPQISTIHMKPQSNILILATEQQSARLFVWDIRAQICLSQIRVNCSIIYGLKLVGDRYAVFYGINSMYQLVLQVVDWKLHKVIALSNFLHSATWKIKDITVLQIQDNTHNQNTQSPSPHTPTINENNIRFVTCGAQHLAQWSIKCNTLIEKNYSNIPPNTSFTVINHIKCQYIITGCSKGNIYMWKDTSLIKQLKVQTGPIRSLEVIIDSNTIICGGMDSMIYVCKYQDEELYVQTGKSLNPKIEESSNRSGIDESSRGQKDLFFQGSSLGQGSFLTQFDIQSIIHSPLINREDNRNQSMNEEESNFFVGTRSGDVYFCEYNIRQKQFISITQIVYGQDHQTIVCTAFPNSQNKQTGGKDQMLYTLTSSGKLQVWDLRVLQKVFSYKFMKKGKKVYIYKEYILICFEREIIFIQLDIRDKILKIDETFTLTFDDVITQCVLSESESYLAIGLHKNESNEILIYELEKKSLIYHSPVLKYEIEYLDFSSDQKYLLYKDKFEQIGMVYLVTLKRINTIFVQMKIQWQTQGLRISPKAQRIYYSYNCQNKITTIAKLTHQYILVADQMGTLRIFPYPPDNDKLGQLHTQCYTLHMNKINSIKQHPNLTYLATSSIYDRSLILWTKTGLN